MSQQIETVLSRHPPEKRHRAAHDIDEGLTAMMACVVAMTDAVFVIGAQDDLVSVRDALEVLHKASMKAHDVAIREMK